MSAFISYQTKDKKIAGEVKSILKKEGIDSFLAHEDIAVSQEWRLEILRQIKKSKIFVAIITKNYLASVWCVQEAGIAAARSKMASICLLLDDTTPPGFLQAVQGRKCRDSSIELADLMPGLVKAVPAIMLGNMIKKISKAPNYRGAEAVYEEIMPYIDKLSAEQASQLLEAGFNNGQVKHAALCATNHIPKVLAMHKKSINEDLFQKIKAVCDSYER